MRVAEGFSRVQRGLVAAVALGASGAAGADETAGLWLERMADALHELRYEGVFVYQHGDRLRAMRILHDTDDSGERERLVALDGNQREVIRDDDEVTCILPDHTSFVLERRAPGRTFPPVLPEDDADLDGYYAFELGEQGRVAGRTTQEVRLQPRDDFRYGYRFRIDDDTGMLLQSELVDNDGEVVERLMFTSIEFRDAIDAEALEPGIEGEEFMWYEHDREDSPSFSGERRWEATSLPPGFEREDYRRHRAGEAGTPVEQLVFSDGLASVSVFVEPADAVAQPLDGHSSRGAVNAFGRGEGDTRITVVGEVPRAAVERIARGMQQREAP
ncbi:MAG: MucB/RseB C-terminal domain-containing protein [Thiohalospira sp.]